MADVRIFKEGKNPSQSGRARAGRWLLRHENDLPTRPEPLMGWAGGTETGTQVQLAFPSLEAALDYAKRQGLTAEVVPEPVERLIIQTYAENFR
jgi:hypothetical protein